LSSTHSVYTDIWCLGLLISQIVTSTDPLGIPTPVLKDDLGASSLRERIKSSDIQKEETELLSKIGNLESVDLIVQSCHAPKPSLRPSAAYIVEQLFDIISSGATDVRLSSDNLVDAKVAIALALEKHSNILPHVDSDHWENLDAAYFNGDPIAAMLIGQAIWRGLKPISTEGNQVVLAPGIDANESKDQGCSSS
jgi:serine/threonine protein kinase